MKDKTVAIMQPYFVPYIGYFQLIHAVDHFVILDDVNYIKKGWINRNQLLINQNPSLFTLPLKAASQNKKISDLEINIDSTWKSKFVKSLHYSYMKSPYFKQVMLVIESIFNSSHTKISEFNLNAIKSIFQYLGFEVKITRSSELNISNELKGQKRIIEICKKLNFNRYVNPIGGVSLYDKSLFKEQNIELEFIQSTAKPYSQISQEFHPNLSILDVMMNNSPESIRQMLNEYTLV